MSKRSSSRGKSFPVNFELLENRRFLSATVIVPIGSPISPLPPGTISPIAGKVIHAETNEAFTVVLGKIAANMSANPVNTILHGTINWGDGSATSDAKFVTESNGSIDVLGSHTYAKAGADHITVTITRLPPPGTLGPVVILSQIRDTADVIPATNGVTLNETANTAFTADLGSFIMKATNITGNLRATINWGDGTVTTGKLIAEPTAFPNAGYEVQGSHTYAQTGSYQVIVTVTESPATPPPGTAAPNSAVPNFILIVAHWDSVIDVLPAVQVTPVTPT